MSDEPRGDGGEPDPTPQEPTPPQRPDDSTLELQAVTDEAPAPEVEQLSLADDEVAGEDPGIDTEMLAAFLGEPVAQDGGASETDVLTGAPVAEDAVIEADVLTGAPVDDAVLVAEDAATHEAASDDEAPVADDAIVVDPIVVEAAEATDAPDEAVAVVADEEVVQDAAVVQDEAVVEGDAGEPAAEPVIEPAGTATGPVSHAAPRRSAWPMVLTVLGVIVALIAVGAAGVYVGRMTAGTPNVVVQSDPAAAAEGDVNVASPSMAVGPLPVPAPGTFMVTTARVPTSTWPVVLNESGQLSDTSGTAPGYRLVNAGISGAQVASILATTFGATGEVVASDTGWTVGQAGEPSITVTSDPLFSWTYEDPAALSLPVSGEPLEPAEAISATTDALAGIGVDISTVEYQVDFTDGRTGVSAWQLVGDQRTQLGWRLVFDSDGAILAASGFSSGLQGVPDYPVVGAATAVARSQQSPWTALPASPVASAPGAAAEEVAPSADATGRPTFDIPMSTVDVVSAELGLAQYWQPDGSILLLPSYILTGADGSTWSLLAVADSAVTFTDQPFPSTDEANGFVAGAFPGDDPETAELDGGVTGDGVTDPAGSEDMGVTDENGDVLFDPSADPAATE